jgi:hypothetical protein
LAASTIDRRLSTVCGFYRFAHIDGRITANPAQYVRRPKIHPREGRGLDRNELGRFLFTAERVDRPHAALAVLLGLNGLRVSEACATNIEDLGVDRGHRTLRIIGKGNKPAVIPLVPRTARKIDLAVGERRDGAILLRHDGDRLDRRAAHRWVRSVGKRAGLGAVPPHMLRAAFIMAALDAGVPLRDVQLAARHALNDCGGSPGAASVSAWTDLIGQGTRHTHSGVRSTRTASQIHPGGATGRLRDCEAFPGRLVPHWRARLSEPPPAAPSPACWSAPTTTLSSERRPGGACRL